MLFRFIYFFLFFLSLSIASTSSKSFESKKSFNEILAPSHICNNVETVGSDTFPLKTSLILDGEIPPLYDNLYADKLFSSNNSIILSLIASGNNIATPTFQKKYSKLIGKNIWNVPKNIFKEYCQIKVDVVLYEYKKLMKKEVKIMEENKTTKISLSTFFLIIAVILIMIMGIFMYKTHNEKIAATEKTEELQTQVKELTENINSLQGKISSISETINSNTSVNNSTTNANQTNADTKSNTEFTDEQVKNAFQNYLELTEYIVDSPEKFLEKIDLKVDNTKKEAKRNGYIKTNIKYVVFKEKLLNYVTDKCYDKNFEKSVFIEEDGFLCYLRDVGATGMDYKVTSIVKNSTNSFNAIVTATPADKVEIKYEFGIENNNGKCLIDYCNEISTRTLE